MRSLLNHRNTSRTVTAAQVCATTDLSQRPQTPTARNGCIHCVLRRGVWILAACHVALGILNLVQPRVEDIFHPRRIGRPWEECSWGLVTFDCPDRWRQLLAAAVHISIGSIGLYAARLEDEGAALCFAVSFIVTNFLHATSVARAMRKGAKIDSVRETQVALANLCFTLVVWLYLQSLRRRGHRRAEQGTSVRKADELL